MKTRCRSSISSEVPFFYPSVCRRGDIAPVGFPKVGGRAAPSANEPHAAPFSFERTLPPDDR